MRRGRGDPGRTVASLCSAALLWAIPCERVAAPGLEFLGSSGPFEKGQVVATQHAGAEGTLGGFSGISFDAATENEWWMVSDRGGKLWKVAIELDDAGRLTGPGAVSWLDVFQIRSDGAPTRDTRCPDGVCINLDAEGVAAGCSDDENLLLVSTEDPADVLSLDSTGVLRVAPGSPGGRGAGASIWAPCVDNTGDCLSLQGNKMLESLTCLRDNSAADPARRSHVAFTGFERPMSDKDGQTTRLLAINPASGELLKTVRYDLDSRAFPDSDDTGLVDLEAIPAQSSSNGAHSVGNSETGFLEQFTVVQDEGHSFSPPATSALDSTRLLSMERSYSAVGGWSIRLFLTASLSSATDVSNCSFGRASSCPVDGSTHAVLRKHLLLDLLQEASTLGVECDNYEAMALGPLLPDGRQVLMLVNDDNCANIDAETCWAGNLIGTQFLAFAFDVNAAVSEMQARQPVRLAPTPEELQQSLEEIHRVDNVLHVVVLVLAALCATAIVAACVVCVKQLCLQKRLKAEALLQLQDVEHGVEDAFSLSEAPSPRGA